VAKRGRKSKYESHVKPHLQEISEAYKRGVEEKKIAEGLGIGLSAWCDYKNKYPEFAQALKRDEADTREILAKLDSALLEAAYGADYEEVKIYETTDADGNVKRHKEKTKKHQPPNVTAIFGAYNRFDKEYVRDRAYYDLKKKEFALRVAVAKDNSFDELDFDFDSLDGRKGNDEE
jgi:hypothetical protein